MAKQESKKKSIGADEASDMIVARGEKAAGDGWERIPFVNRPMSSLVYSCIITALFFLVVLFGLVHHEMWRDELQAWLVARDADSIAGLFKNMRYEGNPALWHFFLFLITRFTHNPVYMQGLHLLFACGFIYVFNRYAEIKTHYKIMFSFGYFTLYEYSVISRSYGLAVLLIFIACALYKNRKQHYILLAVVLALLANVTIYGVIFSLGIYGILGLEYFIDKQRERSYLKYVMVGAPILAVGVILSLYQIIPDKDNSFEVLYPGGIFEGERWAVVLSRIFTTYFYVPKIDDIHFWNTNIFFNNDINLYGAANKFSESGFQWGYALLPLIVFAVSLTLFIRKPFVLLLYAGVTLGLLSVYYYTNLMFLRYCGFLLIIFVVCLWIEQYYMARNYNNTRLAALARIGDKVRKPLLWAILISNMAGAAVAYAKDYSYEFSTSKDAADYIKENKLDTLTIAGMNHYIVSPLAAYLDTKIFYPQRNSFGSFTIFDKQFKWTLTGEEMSNALEGLMTNGRKKILLVLSYEWMATNNGGQSYVKVERLIMHKDLQVDLLKTIDAGIVSDEQYYIYQIVKMDTAGVLK